ncbi:MAG: divergent polysaccharide deacetylase family protein [Alphaproteobacteria bacterium]|nr:divergent polysaccharide deacetylase family protein [Alphaproteobacteria bacterium]
MTKSFLIALAGFAVGLGVTTALMFISPGLEAPDQAARSPLASLPAVEQRVALTPALPENTLDSGAKPEADTKPAPAPAAAKSPPPPSLSPPPAPPPAPAPPTAPAVREVPAALSGPKMPAIRRPGIAAALLETPEPAEIQAAALPNARTASEPPPNTQISNAAIAAEARRREQMEDENVRLANLTTPAILPPAPPPLPPSETVPNAIPGTAEPLPRTVPRDTWQRFAALTPPIEGRAQVAIVLDDMGLSQFRSDRAIALPRPITLAILPYGNHLDGLVARARTAGHEILLHLPMEPLSLDADPGPDALLTGLPLAELDRRIATNLLRLDGYVGVNNHMGSRFTASEREMRRVMRALRARGLLFLDSLTTGKSTGHRLAWEYGLPTVVRDIFLDNDRDPAKIRQQLALTAATAREHGHAIAIGHPYPETLDALESWLPGLRDRGLVLVPISALVKQPPPERVVRGSG